MPVARLRFGAVAAALAALLLSVPSAALAGTLELEVRPLHSRTPGGPCPRTLRLSSTPQPYREGSYGVDGRAALGAIATGWRLASRDAFSATWVATLRPAYRSCRASAGISREDGNSYSGHSHLRLRFDGGQVQLILDMTGMSDAARYTPAILSAGISRGEPVWSWGGAD